MAGLGAEVHVLSDQPLSGTATRALDVRWLDDHHLAGDGAIGWIGTLSTKLEDLKPILYPSSGSKACYGCMFHSYGGVRFFPDGSLVFVPAIDPGVYLYGPDLKLAYTWQT